MNYSLNLVFPFKNSTILLKGSNSTRMWLLEEVL